MAKFNISNAGFGGTDAVRLVAIGKLTPDDFVTLAAELGTQPITARKTGFVSARLAMTREAIETFWNGKESSSVAEPGAWIATNMSADRKILRDKDGNTNAYVIPAARFPQLYALDEGSTDYGEVYRAIGTVKALYFSGGFEIRAPWDEMQCADTGYIVLNGDEVYGNNKETFEMTYVVDI